MRIPTSRACLATMLVALLAACAQQPHRSEPAPAVESSKRPVAAPTPPPKPKPKAKPVAPLPAKADNDTDVTPTPAPSAASVPEGIDRAQVGYYFDTLQGRLRQSSDPAIVVTRTERRIAVDITERVHFQADDASLPAADCAALAPIAKALVEYKMTRIVAEVGVDSSDAATMTSAKSHASAITKCLTEAGVASRRLGAREVAMPAPRTVLRIEPIVK